MATVTYKEILFELMRFQRVRTEEQRRTEESDMKVGAAAERFYFELQAGSQRGNYKWFKLLNSHSMLPVT